MARLMDDSALNLPALASPAAQKAAAADVGCADADATLAARRQQVSPQQMDQVRGRLSPEESQQCSDQMVNQFLRATVGNVDQAVKRLQETLAWRVANGVESAACPACAARPGSHYMHPVGFDARGRPVLYSCLQLASCRSVDDNKAHVIATFEQAIRLMRPGVEQWVIVSDFHGFGFGDLSPRMATAFLEVSAKHYPERLCAFLVVGAPTIFNGLWSMVQPLVDPVSRKKIQMLPYDVGRPGSKMGAALAQLFEPDMVQWLLIEMAQNRDKGTSAKKVYPFGKALGNEAIVDGHDMRGMPAVQHVLQKS